MLGNIWAWIKENKKKTATVAAAGVAAVGGLITWREAITQALSALGLGGQ